MKGLSNSQLEKIDNNIEKVATDLIARLPAEKVAAFIWNKYGYPAGTQNGKVIIKGLRLITVG